MRFVSLTNDAQNQEMQEDMQLKLLLVERFEKCPYCHSKLLFSHELNLEHLEVTENSRCSGCGMHTNPKKHTLQ